MVSNKYIDMSEESTETQQMPTVETGEKEIYKCKYCGAVFKTLPELGTHSRMCTLALKAKIEKAEATGKATPSLYKEEVDPKEILRNILEKYPGLTNREAIIEEVMDWVRLKDFLHPMELQTLLTQLAGVPKNAPAIIAQKYSLALQKASRENPQIQNLLMIGYQRYQQSQVAPIYPEFIPATQPYQPMPMWHYPQPQTQMPTQTQIQPQKVLSEYDVARIVQEQLERSKRGDELIKLRDEIKNLSEDYAGLVEATRNEINKLKEELKPKGEDTKEVLKSEIAPLINELSKRIENLEKQIEMERRLAEEREKAKKEAEEKYRPIIEDLIVSSKKIPSGLTDTQFRMDKQANLIEEVINTVRQGFTEMGERFDRMVEMMNLPSLIAQLQAAGVDKETIAAVIAGKIAKEREKPIEERAKSIIEKLRRVA